MNISVDSSLNALSKVFWLRMATTEHWAANGEDNRAELVSRDRHCSDFADERFIRSAGTREPSIPLDAHNMQLCAASMASHEINC